MGYKFVTDGKAQTINNSPKMYFNLRNTSQRNPIYDSNTKLIPIASKRFGPKEEDGQLLKLHKLHQ